MKPLRVVMRIKNNRLVRLREELGLTIGALAKLIPMSTSLLCALENFSRSPLAATGDDWAPSAKTLAAFHGISPKFLWPDEIVRLRAKRLHLELSSQEAFVLCAGPAEMEREELAAALPKLLSEACNPTEAAVLRSRADGLSFEEIGHGYGLSKSRVQQIASRAAWRMRMAMDTGCARGPVVDPEEIERAIARAATANGERSES